MEKTAVITVTGEGRGIAEALFMTERAGGEAGLDKKSILHLRLLSEEMFGMLRGIAGGVEASYWLETEGKNFELKMKADVKMTIEMREQFLAASSSGKNAAAKGFMGRLRVMIGSFLLSAKEALPYAMINSVAAMPMGGYAGESSSVWSMAIYRSEVEKRRGESDEASDAWDELEKSIVANIADDVKVGVRGNCVELTVCKAF
ncbi:MAG: hypothetical protein J6Z04_07600 [Clostridia bacterium]|nr:hypothetical protein [Clostridia bacterium]